jgi:hypothetical protein
MLSCVYELFMISERSREHRLGTCLAHGTDYSLPASNNTSNTTTTSPTPPLG